MTDCSAFPAAVHFVQSRRHVSSNGIVYNLMGTTYYPIKPSSLSLPSRQSSTSRASFRVIVQTPGSDWPGLHVHSLLVSSLTQRSASIFEKGQQTGTVTTKAPVVSIWRHTLKAAFTHWSGANTTEGLY